VSANSTQAKLGTCPKIKDNVPQKSTIEKYYAAHIRTKVRIYGQSKIYAARRYFVEGRRGSKSAQPIPAFLRGRGGKWGAMRGPLLEA
jgi:hypothetical protein